jgi:hypothetical protein
MTAGSDERNAVESDTADPATVGGLVGSTFFLGYMLTSTRADDAVTGSATAR